MSDFLKILLRKNSLRKQCQSLSVSEIEKVMADLADISEELKAEEARRAEEEQLKQAAIEEIQQKMRAAGIDLSELKGVAESSGPKQTVKAKYQIVDAQGEIHTWSGRGRTPLVFARYMEAQGISKEQLPSAH